MASTTSTTNILWVLSPGCLWFLSGLLTSCPLAFTMTTECCECCHVMTKDTFPFSHIGSKKNRKENVCGWGWRDCFFPRNTWGPYSLVCSVKHSIWMLQDAGFLWDVYPTSSSEETSLLLQCWLCQLLARSFKSKYTSSWALLTTSVISHEDRLVKSILNSSLQMCLSLNTTEWTRLSILFKN